jgi:hypothetical protein
MYFDGEETDDTFTLHNPTKENQRSAEDLEHEIEKFNIEISKLQINECSESPTSIAHSTLLWNIKEDRQDGISLDSGFATGRMSETMIPNYRYSVEVRDDKVNQSAGIGARPKVRFETTPEQSRSVSPEFFRYENKRYSLYKPSCNSDLELPNPMPLKDDKHVTQRRKSLAKSKTFTDKVRNLVPDTTSDKGLKI